MSMRTHIIACAALLCCSAAFAQTPEQVFLNANALYQQGKVAEARAAYESILKNGYVSGELYYNLGNACYRNGDIGRAILNYERALRLIPNDEDLRHNLQLMNLMITDRIEPTPRLFIWEYWDAFAGAITLDAATWIGYGLFILTLVAVALFLTVRQFLLRKVAFVTGLVSLLLLFLAAGVFAEKLSAVTRTDDAIVMARVVNVKNSPDARSSDAFVLHAGVKVRVVDTVAGWLKVRLADGKIGWVEGASLEQI
jgi:tetratricopeptide (TPR) repeat protein